MNKIIVIKLMIWVIALMNASYCKTTNYKNNTYIAPNTILEKNNKPVSEILIQNGFKQMGNFFLNNDFLIQFNEGNESKIDNIFTPADLEYSNNILTIEYGNTVLFPKIKIYVNDSTLSVEHPFEKSTKKDKYSDEDKMLDGAFEPVDKKDGIFLNKDKFEFPVIVIYKNGQILYTGIKKPHPSFFKENTTTLKGLNEKGNLVLQNGPASIEMDKSGECDLIKYDLSIQIPLELTKEQNYTKKDGVFYIGGVNPNATIQELEELNGQKLATIEKRAHENSFLDPKNSLIDLLVEDNSLVQSFNISHPDLADPLFYVINICSYLEHGGKKFNFKYNKREYQCKLKTRRNYIESIFDNDLKKLDTSYTVTDMETKYSVTFSEIGPYDIWRYGFYKGDPNSRIDPRSILLTFFPDRITNPKALYFSMVQEKIIKLVDQILDKLSDNNYNAVSSIANNIVTSLEKIFKQNDFGSYEILLKKLEQNMSIYITEYHEVANGSEIETQNEIKKIILHHFNSIITILKKKKILKESDFSSIETRYCSLLTMVSKAS